MLTELFEVGAKEQTTLMKRVSRLYMKGIIQLQARSLSQSLELRENELKKATAAIFDAAFFLGQSLFIEGKFQGAVSAFQKAFEINPDDPILMNDLALSLSANGDFPSAEPLLRRALETHQATFLPEHLQIAKDMNNLAELLMLKGEYSEAEQLYGKALEIAQKSLGPNHPFIAVVLNNRGELFRSQGDYETAEPLFQRALAIAEQTRGPDHPQVATYLNNLALLLKGKKDYLRAEPLYRRALSIDQKASGPEHPYVARDLNNLAGLLSAR
jgi:tetratricopeptide (TPR) repeat protein